MSASRLLSKKLTVLISVILQLSAYGAASEDSLAHNKEIPAEFERPILTALSYFPELKDTHIIFRIKKAYTPLTTKPDFTSVFKRKGHRTYVITISNETADTLTRLLFQNLSFEEQVGVMGHELSHVVDFNSKNFPGVGGQWHRPHFKKVS
jgi:hypothetical protein